MGMAEQRALAKAENARNDEEAILAAARAGDPAALGHLYEFYVRPVFRYLHSQISDTADAEDVTSQTFLSAFEALPRYRHQGHFAAWLFTIARRKATDHFRRRRAQIDFDDLAMPADGPDPASHVIRSQDLQDLSKRIKALSHEEQDILLLRYVADLSFADIGALIGKSEEAAKKSLYRLLARLRGQMENDHG